MSLILFLGALTFVLLVPAFVFLFRKLVLRELYTGFTMDWFDSFSVGRYKPMERLLDDADFEYLQSCSGYTRGMGRKMRMERRKLFRRYAYCLDRDFTRVCTAIKLLMIHSQVDRPDLFSLLLRKRAWFLMALLSIECRLALHACGLGTVDVRNLVGSLDSMGVQLRELVRIAQPAVAHSTAA